MRNNERNHKLIIRIIAVALAVFMVAGVIFSSIHAGAFDANDYSSSSSSDDDDDGGGVGFLFAIIRLIILIVPFPYNLIIVAAIIAFFFYAYTKRKAGKMKGDSQYARLPNRNAAVVSAVKQFDPAFDMNEMIERAKDTWFQVQTAWCRRDLEPVRHLMGTNLYNTTKRQVQSKIDQHITYHYENMQIPEAWLTSFVRDQEFEYLTVFVHASYIDYQVDDVSGKIVHGDKTTIWHLGYIMKFQRSTAVDISDNKFCPNCGAPLNIATNAKCEYCGTTITNSNHDWVLSDFMTVREDTVDPGVRVNNS